ncbi:hypothetical protein AVFI_19785 [Aliivibrio fischeri ATCC 7744 = JCM 18803 = DSM 507]|nr:hypothetical protein [Aliivibrio fischeri]USR97413.1 hypothetical protein AVFI_19785 [Aliivibrio fischeri ATCC 7744 = JCM 18803 = DSM 507]GGK31262.1 hypothetical protein GCM10007987_13630 [Aliivibrio fischeri]
MTTLYTTKATALAGRNGQVKTAHQVCPYSNAVKGNIDVKLSVNGVEL